MKKPAATLIAVPLAAALATQAMAQQSATVPPVARKVPHTTSIHGYTLSDDYFWLREKANPDVTAYLEAENAYTEEMMRPTKALQETLYKEMLGRIKQTDLSVPSRIGEYFYYSRTEEGKQYPFMCRRQGSMTGAEEVLLDLNQLAEGHKFLGLAAYAVSDDANWLAYSLDTTGYRQYVLHVRDLRTGRDSSERIERVGSVVWATDNKTLVYTTEDAVSKRSDKVFRHTVGAAASELIFEERDELFDVSAGRSLDKKMIFVTSGAKTSTEVRYLPASTPAAPLTVVIPRQPGHEYDVDHYDGELYITTNKGAKNFKVVKAPIADPSERNWTTFIDHTPGLRIGSLIFFARHLVVAEREGGLSYLRVVDMKTRASHRITHRRTRLRAEPGGQSRVRHDDRALQLPVDGDAVVGLRLRHDDEAAHAAQADRGARRVCAGRVRIAGASGPWRATARGCRSRSSIARGRSSMARRRCCCMPTARTAPRSRRRSPRLA